MKIDDPELMALVVAFIAKNPGCGYFEISMGLGIRVKKSAEICRVLVERGLIKSEPLFDDHEDNYEGF